MRTKTIGLIAHTEKEGVAKLARDVSREFKERSLEVIVENETAKIAKQKAGGSIAQIAQRSDLIVVLGGDGTILHVVAMAGKNLKPIFGINVGSLGFLTCVNSSAYREAVDAIVSGRISYSKRALLSVELRTNRRVLSSVHALNDAVISRGELSRLIRLNVKVNGETLTEFNADGLVIATPTGSTAYSLSAGGPILSPESGVFVVTPICPHVLTNRSVIVSDSSVIEVSPGSTEYPTFLSVDGREPMRLPPRAQIAIRRANAMLELGFLPDVSFFSVLRHKLKWTGSNV
ncbi:MAG: ATP-NAD kinase [Verrucomicrobia bacterium]|nr:MAG: ATP-NAD kinase [Verrucomicrobiota bacterium]